MKKEKKYYSKEDAKNRLERYCAMEDRCHSQVEQKLYEMNIYGDDRDEILFDLITENFINEERFARSYARGKFRIKKWGRIKIRQGLKKLKVSEFCIKKGMTEIDESEYIDSLTILIEKKLPFVKHRNAYELRNKLLNYLYQKGYEKKIAIEIINDLTER